MIITTEVLKGVELDEFTTQQLLCECEYPIILEDLLTWRADYEEVQREVGSWLETAKAFKGNEEKFEFFIYKARHNNACDICSDISDYNRPLEALDFNYGSMVCTISRRNENDEPLLLPTFDGYIRRNGEELEGCCSDINYDTVCTIIEHIKQKTVRELING